MTTKTKAELMTTISEFNENGKTKAQIEGWLMFEHSYTVNQSKSLVQEVLGKGNIGGSDWGEVIAYIRESYGKVEKAELIENMCRIKGAKYSSMNHAYNYIKFAKEFARQEVANIAK